MPFLLFVLSLTLAAFAYGRSGAVLSDLMLLALLMAVASLILLLRGAWRRRAAEPAPSSEPPPPSLPGVVVDGSNVMHWREGEPRLETVREVVAMLQGRGMKPGVVFDANAGYKVLGRYQDDADLAWRLNLTEDRVLVVPKGQPADPVILRVAREMGGRVVSNDRYRDWAEQFPEVAEPGFLIRGGYRGGALWLGQ